MFHKITAYLRETKAELKKVIWPTKKETVRHTILVIAVSVLVAVYIGILDFILIKLMGLII